MPESGKPSRKRVHMVLKGRAATDSDLREAILEGRSQGHTITVSVTWEGGDAVRFAREAAQAGVDAVVAAGGDGTVNEVVQGVLAVPERTDCAVGTIPMGTANDFATSAGIPVDAPAEALALILQSEPVRIDVGVVNKLAFVNVATGGIGAEIVAQTPTELKEMLGGVSYSLTGLANVLTLTPRPLRVEGPDFHWEGETFALIAGNARTAGGGYAVAPNAKMDDGLLDVTIVPRLPANEFFRFVGQLLELNGDQEFEEIVRVQVPWMDVYAEDGLALNVDGEPTRDNRFHFEVMPSRLPFILPTL